MAALLQRCISVCKTWFSGASLSFFFFFSFLERGNTSQETQMINEIKDADEFLKVPEEIEHEGGEFTASKLASLRGIRVFYAASEAVLHTQEYLAAWSRIEHDVATTIAVIGVDAEWFNKGPTAVLQITSASQCIIFHVSQLRSEHQLQSACAPPQSCPTDSDGQSGLRVRREILPTPVVRLLEDIRVLKVGVNVSGDAKRLEREKMLVMAPLLDLEHAAVFIAGSKIGRTGLGALTEDVLGLELGKEKAVTLSNWEARRLSPVQLAYAADDAIASFLLCQHLMTMERHADTHHQAPVGQQARTSAQQVAAPQWADSIRAEARRVHRQLARQHDEHKDMLRQADGEEGVGGTNSLQDGKLSAATARKKPAKKTGRRPQFRDQQEAVDPYKTKKLIDQLSSARSSQSSVEVLSVEGTLIFYCDQRKAKWYVEHKKLAVVVAEEDRREGGTPSQETEEVGHLPDGARSQSPDGVKSSRRRDFTHIYKTIRLLFHPRQKSKLCINFQLGPCEFGEHCPFAHGPDELVTRARLQEDDDEEDQQHEEKKEGSRVSLSHQASSATRSSEQLAVVLARPQRPVLCCLCGDTSAHNLARHAVVPPSFRRHLPPPFDNGIADDFVFLCLSCNARVRVGYDKERQLVEQRAMAEHGCPKIDMNRINRVSRYAVLLLDEAQRAVLPANRVVELYAFVVKNFACCYTSIRNQLPSSFAVDGSGEQSRDGAGGAQVLAALAEVSAIVPGDVYAKQVMLALVGHDLHKAAQFVQQWRIFFQNAFRPIEGTVLFASTSRSSTLVTPSLLVS